MGGEVALAGADDEVLRECADGVRATGFDPEDIDRDTLGENQRGTLADGRLAGKAW
ncbi:MULTISPECIES: hypothetical protein [unclassified Rhodococcus (in: high G+C Gram-positive bacteria)]|uniref:hypothetical protein n=1 Tax=unclassified Rhodococcus (in: high G+C Gram-positive bacteria) TaxID=192944 RepID=UPI00163A082D|nr:MULTISPECIES: hypothetical protein [unclassified Rhodococcus (in: high G+C Gram-positive bacteria)]MBC2644191.1 hypothetical protein [Rhodococcus sp. 3A]MBC2891070.1 hypothetical protein [Rhodococcus sp. 4CII]